MTTVAGVQRVSINLADGEQIILDESDTVTAPFRGEIALEEIPSELSKPAGWIEYETEARYEDASAEEWQRQQDDWQPATARIFGRHVVSLLTVYG